MYRFHRLFALFLTLGLLLVLTACGTSTELTETPAGEESSSPESSQTQDPEESSEEETAPDVAYKVALLTDAADVSDPAEVQAVNDACMAFCEQNGVEFSAYQAEEDTPEARGALVDTAVADGYNVLVLLGHPFGDTLVAKSGLYSEAKFLTLDVTEEDILSAALGAEYDGDPENWDVTRYYNTNNVTSVAAVGDLESVLDTLLT